MQCEKIAQDYISIWLNKDETIIPRLFAEDIVYTEFMGTVYQGVDQCLKWFQEWNRVGKVLKWEIQNTYETGNTMIVEWYFESEYMKNTDGFNGVSVIVVNEAGKISSVREYYAKAERSYPFGEINR